MVKPAMSATSISDPVDYADIQGLVRFAHGRLTESAFLLVRIKDVPGARQWLAGASITHSASLSPLPESALQLAFTAQGLEALGVAETVVREFSEEFTGGMRAHENRSRRLGDIAGNDPQHWLWGGKDEQNPHLLLMVYTPAGQMQDKLREIRQADFKGAFDILNTLTAKSSGPEEPFGFADGISQPEIDWQARVDTDPHTRDHYSNLLALGEILLGYPNEYGLFTARPLLNPAEVPHTEALPAAADQPGLKDLGRNGTYLVLRQLAQDVTGFWKYFDEQAQADEPQREALAAAAVGRQRDGTPLVSQSHDAITGIRPNGADNQFLFDDDPMGRQCPIGSHVRRANPRTGDFPPGVSGLLSRLIRILGFGRQHPGDDLVASTRFHRLLRRGRAYGSTLTPAQALRDPPLKKSQEERGLYFLCLGANISRQFEFVQNAWAMNSKFAGLPTQSDPLLGNREPLVTGEQTDKFTLPQTDAPARCLEGLPQFVTVRGGAYFFMPGIRALEFIVGQH
jgi:Dyp-type peroxidase family